MRLRTAKRVLWTTSAVLLTAAVVVGYISIHLSLDHATQAQAPAPQPNELQAVSEADRLPELEELQRIASIEVRQQLFDPPPPPPEVVPPKPLPKFSLIGTVVNASGSQAMISNVQGKVEFKRVGEQVGEEGNYATIMEIRPAVILVSHNNTEHEVVIAEQGVNRR